MLKGRGDTALRLPGEPCALRVLTCVGARVGERLALLEVILDVEDSGLFRGYETRKLRTPEALADFLCECGEISCHTDPV